MNKIGILGGTFDPIHNGHIYLAQTALTRCSLDKIMFLPLNVPPHKPSPVANPLTRYRLIEKSIAPFDDMFVSDMEINRIGVTYTVDTLSELKEEQPNWSIYYIIGTDTLYDLEKWRSIEKVFSLCSFICMARPMEITSKQADYAKQLEKKYNGSIEIIEVMGKDISSTRIRSASAKELPSLVPTEIANDVIKIYAKDE